MDYFLFTAVVKALGEVLPGARVRRVFHTTPLGVGLELGGGILYFALDPARAGVYWLKDPSFLSKEADHFARYLGSLLRGAVIRRVSQVPSERILHLELVKKDLVGHGDAYILVAEIMGRHSNLMVLDNSGKILEAAKRIYRDMSRVREVLPGRSYTPPPPHNRLDPFALDREAFLELLTREATPLESLARHALFPPYALREMEYRMGDVQGPWALLKAWEVGQEMREEMEEGVGHLYRRGESPIGVYPFPLHHLGQGEVGPLLSLLEAFVREKWEGQVAEALRSRLLKAVRKELRKVGKILAILEKEEKETQDVQRFKKWGETLFIHLSRIPPGTREVEMEDPYSPGEMLKIPIPQGLTPSRAAQEYFRRYSKLKRKARAMAARKEGLEARKGYLEELEWLLGSAQGLEELEIMRGELEAGGLGMTRDRGRGTAGKGRRSQGPSVLPYRVFRSSMGNTILVGRHPRGNEEVTFKRSHRRDLWFHVRAYPGAHVILKSSQPLGQEIQEAAALAAYFSKARQSPAVDVDYTQRRYVRKIPKAAPGLVTYTNFSTIRVEPQIPPGVVEEG